MDALCVELACERITEEALEALKRACDAFAEAVKSKDIKVIAKADVALHDIIVQATGNSRLVQLINNLSEQMYRYRFEYLKDCKRHENLIEEHRIIYESIVKRDKEAASAAAKLHIDNQEHAIIQQIRLEKGK
jgi:DNA-binding GntR family transcriptional regulator